MDARFIGFAERATLNFSAVLAQRQARARTSTRKNLRQIQEAVQILTVPRRPKHPLVSKRNERRLAELIDAAKDAKRGAFKKGSTLAQKRDHLTQAVERLQRMRDRKKKYIQSN